jgi:hypothetical protein
MSLGKSDVRGDSCRQPRWAKRWRDLSSRQTAKELIPAQSGSEATSFFYHIGFASSHSTVINQLLVHLSANKNKSLLQQDTPPYPEQLILLIAGPSKLHPRSRSSPC